MARKVLNGLDLTNTSIINVNNITASSATLTNATVSSAPSGATDVTNKSYVDSVAQGLSIKDSVHAATTTALAANTYNNGSSGVGATLTGNTDAALGAIDGVTLTLGDRLLVKNEASPAHNGIYTFTQDGDGSTVPYILTRSTDMDTSAQIAGAFTFVENGTVNSGSGWVVNSYGPFTIGTTAINFTQFSGAGELIAGNGISITGNTITAVGTTNRITVSPNIDIASNYVGQTSITTLGTITTGTWNGSTIQVANGGTGATSFTSNGVLFGNGTGSLQVTTAGSADQVLVIPHAGGSPTFGAVNLSASAATTGTLPYTAGGTGLSTLGTANQILGVNAGATALEYKSLTSTGGTIAYTNSAGSLNLDVVNNTSTQKVKVAQAGTVNSTRQEINFINGTGITVTVADNSGSDRADVTITATNSGTVSKFAASIGDGSSTSYTVNHNLGSRDVEVQIYDNSTFAFVETDVVSTDANNVSITFNVAPTTNQYRVVVLG